MAELDSIPVKSTVEIESVKLDDSVINSIKELNQQIQNHVVDFGEIYLRKKDLFAELDRLETIVKEAEDSFQAKNAQLKEILDGLDDKYPQGRVNLQEGTIVYQPGLPSRKQMAQQQQSSRDLQSSK